LSQSEHPHHRRVEHSSWKRTDGECGFADRQPVSYIFPLLNFNNDTYANVTCSQYLMWQPLYWFK
jgi:hypothetical protein